MTKNVLNKQTGQILCLCVIIARQCVKDEWQLVNGESGHLTPNSAKCRQKMLFIVNSCVQARDHIGCLSSVILECSIVRCSLKYVCV